MVTLIMIIPHPDHEVIEIPKDVHIATVQRKNAKGHNYARERFLTQTSKRKRVYVTVFFI